MHGVHGKFIIAETMCGIGTWLNDGKEDETEQEELHT